MFAIVQFSILKWSSSASAQMLACQKALTSCRCFGQSFAVRRPNRMQVSNVERVPVEVSAY